MHCHKSNLNLSSWKVNVLEIHGFHRTAKMGFSNNELWNLASFSLTLPKHFPFMNTRWQPFMDECGQYCVCGRERCFQQRFSRVDDADVHTKEWSSSLKKDLNNHILSSQLLWKLLWERHLSCSAERVLGGGRREIEFVWYRCRSEFSRKYPKLWAKILFLTSAPLPLFLSLLLSTQTHSRFSYHR